MFPDGLVPRELTPVYKYRAVTTMLTGGGGGGGGGGGLL